MVRFRPAGSSFIRGLAHQLVRAALTREKIGRHDQACFNRLFGLLQGNLLTGMKQVHSLDFVDVGYGFAFGSFDVSACIYSHDRQRIDLSQCINYIEINGRGGEI